MASIYRTVAITTDHIGQMRIFFDKEGNDHYGVCYLDNGSLLWQCVDSNGYETTVTHTIEAIELPTDKEVIEAYKDRSVIRTNAFTKVVNCLKNFIEKGGKG